MRLFVVTLLAGLILATPASAIEPICHGELAPKTAAEEEQALIEGYMAQRAEFGFRSDEAYVRELIRRGVWEYDVGYIPVTPEENEYLRLRDKLDLGRKAQRYLNRRKDLFAGLSIEDDWPREPYLLVRLTRDRASHEYNLKRLARYPDNLRTVQVLFSMRELRRVQNRISDDWEALKAAGFDMTTVGVDIDTNTVEVELITKRTDGAAYFKSRYGPVTVVVIASEPDALECEQANYYSVSRDGTGLTVFWQRSGSAKSERIDVVEHDDRVEVGVVDRVPNGPITADAELDHRRVRLSRPLGDRAVIDLADGRRLLQYGPDPGEPPCPARDKPPSLLEESIAYRREVGLPHGRAYVRRMLRSKESFTKAERRYLAIRDALEFQPGVFRYERRHDDEFGGSSIEGTFPHTPVLVMRFTDHLARHRRNLERLTKYRVRVVRARYTERELHALEDRIGDDATDAFLDGFGDAGFFLENLYVDRGRVVVQVRTPRTDAAGYFRERYGPAVKVTVLGRRYECRENL